jgi:hypothetical protein
VALAFRSGEAQIEHVRLLVVFAERAGLLNFLRMLAMPASDGIKPTELLIVLAEFEPYPFGVVAFDIALTVADRFKVLKFVVDQSVPFLAAKFVPAEFVNHDLGVGATHDTIFERNHANLGESFVPANRDRWTGLIAVLIHRTKREKTIDSDAERI